MADSQYFDSAYFDPDYFDAGAGTSSGHAPKGVITVDEPPDDDELLALI